jgi:hypothetical protein
MAMPLGRVISLASLSRARLPPLRLVSPAERAAHWIASS